MPAATLVMTVASSSSNAILQPQMSHCTTVRAECLSRVARCARLLQSGKPDDAERILRQVLTTASQNSDAHNLLGIILDQQGKVAEAEREYRAAIRFKPSNVSAIANLGVLLAHANRSAEAIKTFESVLRMVPDHPQATLNLGLQSAAAGDDKRAIPLLEKAISLGLDGYEVRYRLALSLYNVKRFADAKQNFDVALVVNPNAAGPHFYLGLMAWAAGQDEAAAESWERAVTLQPVFPEANFMLGEALRKHQRTAAAVEFYRRALDQETGRYVYYARLGGPTFCWARRIKRRCFARTKTISIWLRRIIS